MKCLLALLSLLACIAAQDDFLYGTFPAGFKWGVSTSSYQIEGAWNLSGKGENIWDTMVHSDPSGVVNRDTGDVACDSYHLYQTDVAMMQELGVNYYRFSLSWSRILPTGRNDVINQDGIDYYNRLIDQLLQQGVEPIVSLYHWDLPQPLQDEFGGWLGEEIVEIFGDYVTVAFQNFGDRVKQWITLVEPWVIAEMGYGTAEYAPRINGSGTLDYVAGHNLLKAHARAWHIYDDQFRALQQGEIGITLDSSWFEPASLSQQDIDAADRAIQFKLGWFAHAIYSDAGDYPTVLKEQVARHSEQEGLPVSRLPEFDAAWIDYIRGTSDFFGLNHYTSSMVVAGQSGSIPSFWNDQDQISYPDPDWPPSANEGVKVVPWGFRKLVNWIKDSYNNPRILVTENGFPDTGDLDDQGRVNYHTSYINELMKAVNLDGCDVQAYFIWSLMDNFEWYMGYTHKYGLYQVDFSDPMRPRRAKTSAGVYKQIISDNGFPDPQ